MGNVGNAFGLPFKSPNWFSTFLVIGLIFIIPVVGWINMTGWMLATLDNYRQGRTELPPAGFGYIGRGVNVFVVGLVYALVIGLVLLVPLFTLMGLVGATAVTTGNSSSNPGAPAAFAGGGLFPLWMLAALVVGIVEYVFLPAVILNTERGGIGGGLNVLAVVNTAASNWKNAFLAGILIYVAYFIGGLGIYACCVGILVSYPYATAVVAGILRFYEAATYEQQPTTPPQLPGPPPGIPG